MRNCGVTLSAGQANNLWRMVLQQHGRERTIRVHGCGHYSKMNDQTVLLPLYDVATGNGSSGKYYINLRPLAAFHVTGYHFP